MSDTNTTRKVELVSDGHSIEVENVSTGYSEIWEEVSSGSETLKAKSVTSGAVKKIKIISAAVNILLEDGNDMLLEDGNLILLES